MIRFLAKRLLHGLAVLWVVVTLTFVLLRILPGGPFDSERRLPPEIMANIQAKYHLDEPWLKQYARYLTGVAQGDRIILRERGKPGVRHGKARAIS